MDGPGDYHIKWSKSDRERQIADDIPCMWSLKNDTNVLIYKTEKQKQIHRFRQGTYGQGTREKSGEGGRWDWHVHTAIFKIDNQQRSTVYYRKIFSIFYNDLNGKRTWKRIRTCIIDLLCCTPETKTTVSVNYTPI